MSLTSLSLRRHNIGARIIAAAMANGPIFVSYCENRTRACASRIRAISTSSINLGWWWLCDVKMRIKPLRWAFIQFCYHNNMHNINRPRSALNICLVATRYTAINDRCCHVRHKQKTIDVFVMREKTKRIARSSCDSIPVGIQKRFC